MDTRATAKFSIDAFFTSFTQGFSKTPLYWVLANCKYKYKYNVNK